MHYDNQNVPVHCQMSLRDRMALREHCGATVSSVRLLPAQGRSHGVGKTLTTLLAS